MAKKSGSLKTKRADVPAFWKISKKDKRYVVRTEPGPHPKSNSYPLLVLLRDVLKVAKTNKVITQVLLDGKITVDGKVVKSPRFPIGLMDVVEIPSISKAFRIVPYRGGLEAVEIDGSEKTLKLCMVKRKSTLRGTKLAYGLHDGRVITPQGVKLGRGDSCTIKLPGQEFQSSFELEKNSFALLTNGEKSGEVVTIEDLKSGTFSRGAMASVKHSDGTISELSTEILMPLGKEIPQITVSRPKS